MKNNIFLPDKIKAGFNLRKDTYSGLLGYVIPWDGKKWRQEQSWENWRQRSSTDERLKPLELKNELIEGFVLNKKTGDEKYGWNPRIAWIRVWDPRGFEIEIKVNNLLYILANTDCTVGKGLVGKFIYGWDGKNLMLIPESAPEFQNMKTFTALKNKKITSKDLKIFDSYINANKEIHIYLGKYNTFYKNSYYWEKKPSEKYSSKKYWFYNVTKNEFVHLSILNSISEKYDTDQVYNYAEIMDKLEHNAEYSNYTGQYKYFDVTEDFKKSDPNYPNYKYFAKHDNIFYPISSEYFNTDYSKGGYIKIYNETLKVCKNRFMNQLFSNENIIHKSSLNTYHDIILEKFPIIYTRKAILENGKLENG